MRTRPVVLALLALSVAATPVRGVLAESSAPRPVLFVNPTAAGKGDGSSWVDAFRDPQQALAVARAGQQTWVRRGTYLPTRDADRTRSFVLVEGVEVYGGFAGTEARLEQRDWRRNPTIRSGNMGRKGDASDDVQHVIRGSSEAILDGATASTK